MKVCSSCRESLPVDLFNARGRGGYQAYCRPCTNAKTREWRQQNPEKATEQRKRRRAKPGAIRQENLRDRYKLSIAEYDALLEAQGGVCAICLGPPNGHGRFHVDHDHACCPGDRTCGKCLRGLTCSSCNWLLGMAREKPEIMLRAIAYLERHSLDGREHDEPDHVKADCPLCSSQARTP